jgi:hypothetical protein
MMVESNDSVSDELGDRVAERGDDGYVPPEASGCWFCNRGPEAGKLFFSMSFDTYYHRECAIQLGVWDGESDPVHKWER